MHMRCSVSSIAKWFSRRRFWCAVGAVVTVHVGLLAWSAFVHSPTWDEPMHLAGGLRHLQFGRFDIDRGNPPLVASLAAVPVLLAEPVTDWTHAENPYIAGTDFATANGARIIWLTSLGRLACIPFCVLGALICYRWAAELYGGGAGLTALALWCFCPFILGHAPLVTADVAAASVGIAACYAFRAWLQRRTATMALAAGACLGAAEVTKYVWVILFALWPAIWWVWNRLSATREERAPLRQLVLIFFVAIYGVNVAYLFVGSFSAGNSYPILTSTADRLVAATGRGGAMEAVANWTLATPVPLPADYVNGAGEVTDLMQYSHECYLRGVWQRGGWWYYYLYGLGMKLPVGTLTLLPFAAAIGLNHWRRRESLRQSIVLLTFPVAVLLFVSALSGCHHHVRYAMPALPFLFVYASRAAVVCSRARPIRTSLFRACLVLSLASTMAVYPHEISYFNEVAGGTRHGDEHLVDSNFDWGQDLLYLKRWYDAHPEARPLHLAYFGPVNPRAIGLDFTAVPKSRPAPAGGKEFVTAALEPGWYAISASWAHGYVWRLPSSEGGFEMLDWRCFEYFLKMRPTARAGYSIFIYHVSASKQS